MDSDFRVVVRGLLVRGQAVSNDITDLSKWRSAAKNVYRGIGCYREQPDAREISEDRSLAAPVLIEHANVNVDPNSRRIARTGVVDLHDHCLEIAYVESASRILAETANARDAINDSAADVFELRARRLIRVRPLEHVAFRLPAGRGDEKDKGHGREQDKAGGDFDFVPIVPFMQPAQSESWVRCARK